MGKVRVISDVSKINTFKEGEVLVTKNDGSRLGAGYENCQAIVTNEGGKTCHAAIVARELGVPTIVGTQGATDILKTGRTITVDCTQG